ncbi:MAG: hypothetical protein HQL26_01930 [Candidatus Omnitrophica bacterium]|nr:hypothetical protein [Candidatus Omnitrophota bacterium]
MKMKKIFLFIFFILAIASAAFATPAAEPINFQISATVPAATGAKIEAFAIATGSSSMSSGLSSKTSVVNIDWSSAVDSLYFGNLLFDSDNKIWIAPKYFAINVSPVGGAGSVNVTIRYTEGSMPPSQKKGLGYKGMVNFIKVVNNKEQAIDGHGWKIFKEISAGEQISKTLLTGGYLRLYVGLLSGQEKDLMSRGGEPFYSTDKPGTYMGTLTISTTTN